MTKVYRIAVLIGSIRGDSLNRRLARQLEAIAPSELLLREVRIDDLPLYSEDDDENQALSVRRLKSEIAKADGVLFVTPEYNRSVPGVLKNAIDHASRPYGESSWTGKPAAVLGISLGAFGTAMAQQHLRNILAYLDMPTLGQPEVFLKSGGDFFAPDGSIKSPDRAFLHDWMSVYAGWIKRHSRISQQD